VGVATTIEMSGFACFRGDSQPGEETIRRINEACADFPDPEDKDFLRLADASAAKLTEDDEW